MTRDTAERVRDCCIEMVGERLRVVGVFAGDSFEEAYIREDLQPAFEEQPLDSANYPFSHAYRSGHLLSKMYDTLGECRATIQDFAGVTLFQFPVGESRVVIVSIDADGDPLPTDLYRECLGRLDGAT